MKNNKVLKYMLGGYCSFLAGMMIVESFNDFNLFYCFLLFIMIPSVCVYKSHQIFLKLRRRLKHFVMMFIYYTLQMVNIF